MKQTYHQAMAQVFADEGGYTNDAADPGGPTNWGITIFDARLYWKKNATAADVKAMPKSVAEEIYRKHYADAVHYDDLPPGLDYAVLDYGINSGVSRSIKVLQRIVASTPDGVVGPNTMENLKGKDVPKLINQLYDERLNFLKSLRTWSVFGKGWSRRVSTGRKLALKLYDQYKDEWNKPSVKAPPLSHSATAGGAIVAAGTAAAAYPNTWTYVILGAVGVGVLAWFVYHVFKKAS